MIYDTNEEMNKVVGKLEDKQCYTGSITGIGEDEKRRKVAN
jgi:hypothetical protein